MLATQFAPAPSRRNSGGLPARCSAIILVCVLALAPAAYGATVPMQDPAPNPQLDAAPVVVAVGGTANLFALDTPLASSKSSVSDALLFAAGTVLLLFVGAVASVLRLAARISGDISAGRLLGSGH